MVDPVKAGALGRQLNPFFPIGFRRSSFSGAFPVQLSGGGVGGRVIYNFLKLNFFPQKKLKGQNAQIQKNLCTSMVSGGFPTSKGGFWLVTRIRSIFFSPKIQKKNPGDFGEPPTRKISSAHLRVPTVWCLEKVKQQIFSEMVVRFMVMNPMIESVKITLNTSHVVS